MANQMIFKTFTSKRMQNMRQCDGKNYKFSADWSQPQPRNICAAAIKSVSEKLALIAKQPAWGTKEDTPALVAELAALLPTAQLGADDMQNAFIAYQAERYFLRIWWRGTSEEREKLVPKAQAPAKKATAKKAAAPKTAAKKETAAPAPAPKAAAKKASKKTGKTVSVKAEVVEDQIEPEIITVDAPTKAVGKVMETFVQLLTEELTSEQKQRFVTALTIALQQSF